MRVKNNKIKEYYLKRKKKIKDNNNVEKSKENMKKSKSPGALEKAKAKSLALEKVKAKILALEQVKAKKTLALEQGPEPCWELGPPPGES